ncbi:hypothetical protein Pint_27583 [Pistacia integerrima]|uniref:Uncharacterized protein n=1 Tax=Pistacia integerrima TaxID=434235 RepID=A0ACC0YMN2_9ROSI|nr:hypothetical protein Pint_27583 [Pistacia integerrima]
MEEKCGSAAICFVSFLLDILDFKADGRNKYFEMMLAVAEKFKRNENPLIVTVKFLCYGYVWAAAGKQPDLEKHDLKVQCNENYVNIDPANTKYVAAYELYEKCVKDLFCSDILEPKCTFASPNVDQREMPRRALQENPTNFILSPPKIPGLWCRVDNFSPCHSDILNSLNCCAVKYHQHFDKILRGVSNAGVDGFYAATNNLEIGLPNHCWNSWTYRAGCHQQLPEWKEHEWEYKKVSPSEMS